MIRISSITGFLLIASLLVSCAQPEPGPAPTLSPAPTQPLPVTVTLPPSSETPTAVPDPSSAPVIGPVDGVIEFAGRMWNVKAGCGLGPGPNCWSDSAESVWVQAGQLHLKVREVEGKWHSAEVSSVECTQYGTHRFFVNTELNSLDKNIVAALFLYQDDQREIDMEFSRWGEETSAENAQYVVQPWDFPGNLHRFAIPSDRAESTHSINRGPSSIRFQSIQGHSEEPQLPEELLAEWEYTGAHIPNAEDCLRVHINLWQVGGNPPSNDQETVFIVSDLQLPDPYRPEPASTLSTQIATPRSGEAPSVEITAADSAHVGGLVGPDSYCNENYRVVIFARTDIWYVQPFSDTPLTMITPETCTWESLTHAWDQLSVFLVTRDYDPPDTLSSPACPPDLADANIIASDCHSP